MLKKRNIIFIVLIVFILYIILNAAEIISYGRIDEKQISDTAVILGAASLEGKVSPVYQGRIDHGIWLYKNGYVHSLIMTGGFGENQSISDSHAAMDYAIKQGIPQNDIYIEEKSKITQENLEQAKIIMENNGLKTAVIVSDPLHMKRSMLMAKDYDITVFSSPTPVSAYKSLKTKAEFLAREEFFYIGYKIYRLVSDFPVTRS